MVTFQGIYDPIEELYNAPGGPGNIYRNYLRQRTPAGASGLYRNYAQRQQQPYEDVFEQLRGFGDIAPRGTLGLAPQGNYQTFLEQQGGAPAFNFGAPDPTYLRGLAQRAGSLISGPREGLAATPLAFRQKLIETPREQFNLALQAIVPGVPEALRPWLERVAQEAFDKFMVTNPQGTETPGQGFLPQFINRGFSFF